MCLEDKTLLQLSSVWSSLQQRRSSAPGHHACVLEQSANKGTKGMNTHGEDGCLLYQGSCGCRRNSS